MTFYSKIKKAIRNLGLNDPKAWNPSLWNSEGSQSLSGETVTEETALNYSAVWNAVALISGTISTLPLHLLRKDKRKTLHVTEKPLYRVLHDRFNPHMTAQVGREVMAAHILTWGNCYAEKVKNGYGEIVELWPIPPNRITGMGMESNTVYYEIKVGNETKRLSREKILHIPGLGFDGFVGYSVISMARKSIGLGMAMETFGSHYFGQGTHPGVIVSHPDQMSAQTHSNLKKSLTDTYSGLGQAHRLMLLDEGMKLENVGIPPEDSQFLECVAPETLFTMSNGTRKAAKEIQVNDNILAWDNNELTISRVAAIGIPKKKTLIKIKTARGRELTASEDHPCLAIQKLRTPGCRVPKTNTAKWTALKNLKIGSYVRVALDIAPIINLIQKNRLTTPPDWMGFKTGYFLGAMAGDGYIRKLSCSFTNADIGVIAYMGEIIKSFGGALKQKGHKPNNYNHDIITNGKAGCKGSCIRTLLNDSGLVGKHSDTKTVPACIMRGGPDAWKGFLSGYFDTDGSIRKQGGKQTPAMYWSSTSLQMIEECQHLLAMLGIQSSIYPMSQGGTKKIMGKICDYLPSWGLYVMGTSQQKKAAETLSLSHTEKTKRLKDYLTTETSRYREENFLYDRIVSIEEIGEGETIGIEVDGCHTHVTGGIITHNSRQFQIPEIARWFNLPPHKLKDLTRSSFSNIESEQISFVTDSILPWLIRLEQNYNMQLLTEPEQFRQMIYTRHNVDGLMRGDSVNRSTYYKTMFGTGAMTINEIRGKESWDPSDEPYADELFVPVNNMVPLSKIDEYLAKAQAQPAKTEDKENEELVRDKK